jgi:ketosteroid isomerase-like protein
MRSIGIVSRTDVQELQARYEAGGRGDWAAFFADVHEDFELVTPERGPLGSTTVPGREAAREAFRDFFAPYEEVSIEPQQIFEHGDRTVVYFVMRCRPSGSSAAVEIQAGHLWTMRDGIPARLQIFPEREQALRAATRA